MARFQENQFRTAAADIYAKPAFVRQGVWHRQNPARFLLPQYIDGKAGAAADEGNGLLGCGCYAKGRWKRRNVNDGKIIENVTKADEGLVQARSIPFG